MDPSARADCLYRLAELIKENQEELALLESINGGKPVQAAKNI